MSPQHLLSVADLGGADGINEVLELTMRERREAGGDVEAMKGVTTGQIQQVKAATSALRQLREGLWSRDEEDAPDELLPGD